MKTEKREEQEPKKQYQKPELIQHGDIRDITMGGSPGAGDSGPGSATEQPF